MKNNKKTLAAIVAYNRPTHLKICILNIKRSLDYFDDNIKLIIFLDCDSNHSDDWNECRMIAEKSGFDFHLNSYNMGLRDNIYKIFAFFKNSLFDRLILIEDDIKVSPDFFHFFNSSFDLFEDTPKVSQISGFSPINDLVENAFTLYPRISTWGWGTWKSKLPSPEEVSIDWSNFTLSKKAFNTLSKYAPDTINLFYLQKKKKITTWSLDYYNYMLVNDFLTVYPMFSVIENIGFDGSGINNGNMKPLFKIFNPQKSVIKRTTVLEEEIDRTLVLKYFIKYYSPNIFSKIIYKLFGFRQ